MFKLHCCIIANQNGVVTQRESVRFACEKPGVQSPAAPSLECCDFFLLDVIVCRYSKRNENDIVVLSLLKICYYFVWLLDGLYRPSVAQMVERRTVVACVCWDPYVTGSIPVRRIHCSFLQLLVFTKYRQKLQYKFPIPGIEPEPPGWKPGILATRPYGICKLMNDRYNLTGALNNANLSFVSYTTE